MKINILYLFILGLFISCNNENNTTKVKIIPKEFNWGDINLNDSITHLFGIKNIGTQTLKIISVETSCGCTVPELEQKQVLPDSMTYVKISFKPTDTGIIKKAIVLKANTDSVYTVFYIKGHVSSVSKP